MAPKPAIHNGNEAEATPWGVISLWRMEPGHINHPGHPSSTCPERGGGREPSPQEIPSPQTAAGNLTDAQLAEQRAPFQNIVAGKAGWAACHQSRDSTGEEEKRAKHGSTENVGNPPAPRQDWPCENHLRQWWRLHLPLQVFSPMFLCMYNTFRRLFLTSNLPLLFCHVNQQLLVLWTCRQQTLRTVTSHSPMPPRAQRSLSPFQVFLSFN